MVNQNDVANNIQLIPIVTTHSAGASGAIFGVMAAFAYLFPNTYFRDIFFPIPIKAKIMVPLMIVFSYVAILRGQNDGVGHYAHIGGAIFGFLLVLFWNKTNKKDFY
jgi:membrane associated rhomboid family serine protease